MLLNFSTLTTSTHWRRQSNSSFPIPPPIALNSPWAHYELLARPSDYALLLSAFLFKGVTMLMSPRTRLSSRWPYPIRYAIHQSLSYQSLPSLLIYTNLLSYRPSSRAPMCTFLADIVRIRFEIADQCHFLLQCSSQLGSWIRRYGCVGKSRPINWTVKTRCGRGLWGKW